jgi:porin
MAHVPEAGLIGTWQRAWQRWCNTKHSSRQAESVTCSASSRGAIKGACSAGTAKALLLSALCSAFALPTPFFGLGVEAQESKSTDASTRSPSPAQAPPSQPPVNRSRRQRLDCTHPADPHRRHIGCKDEEFDWDATLSKAWKGVRKELRALGMTPTLSYTGVLQTNATGGPHQVWSYAGQLAAGLDFNLEKSLKVRGMSVYVGASWGTGSDMSGFLHSLFPVNSIYGPNYYLGEMYLQQILLDKKLTLVGGRLGAANTLATLPVFANYVNYGINPTPYSLGANDISFFGPPVGTEWGALALYDATPLIQVSAGLFNTNPHSANGEDHGADFALQQGNKGALVVGQVSFFPHQIEQDEGRQSEYSIGFLSDNNSFPDLSGNNNNGGGYWGVFVQGQEQICQPDGPGTARGLTVWASWAYNSKPVVSPIPVFWGAGASYEGLLPARKKDVISAGWIYGRVSSSIPSTTAEQVFELNYNLRIGRFLVFTPDFQYIWKPGGYNVPGAAVAGIQARVTF